MKSMKETLKSILVAQRMIAASCYWIKFARTCDQSILHSLNPFSFRIRTFEVTLCCSKDWYLYGRFTVLLHKFRMSFTTFWIKCSKLHLLSTRFRMQLLSFYSFKTRKAIRHCEMRPHILLRLCEFKTEILNHNTSSNLWCVWGQVLECHPFVFSCLRGS